MSAIIAATAFALLLVLRKRSKIPWWVNATLAAIGGASLADTGIGSWFASTVIGGVTGWLAGVTGGSGTLVAGVAALILTVIVVYDIAVDKKADKPAMAGLMLLPMLFIAAAGPLAGAGTGLADAVAQLGTSGLSAVVGG